MYYSSMVSMTKKLRPPPRCSVVRVDPREYPRRSHSISQSRTIVIHASYARIGSSESFLVVETIVDVAQEIFDEFIHNTRLVDHISTIHFVEWFLRQLA